MKSKLSPREHVFQIEVLDFKHRQSVPKNSLYVDKSGKGIKEIVDRIPRITLFRHARTAEQAKRSASKKGSVVSCQKAAFIPRLQKIDYLRIEPKPIVIDISAEEFTVGRDLQIESLKKTKKIDVNGT